MEILATCEVTCDAIALLSSLTSTNFLILFHCVCFQSFVRITLSWPSPHNSCKKGNSNHHDDHKMWSGKFRDTEKAGDHTTGLQNRVIL